MTLSTSLVRLNSNRVGNVVNKKLELFLCSFRFEECIYYGSDIRANIKGFISYEYLIIYDDNILWELEII